MAQRIEQGPPKDEEDEIIAQVARYPRLSNAQEQRLLATQGADRDAANRTLIEHNLHLVVEAAQARKRRRAPFGDVFQAGTVVLVLPVRQQHVRHGGLPAPLLHVIYSNNADVLVQTAE